MAFEAQYAGRCGDCGEGIAPGQLIERRHDGSAADTFVHQVCDGPAELGLRKGEVVCDRCFLVKPCECEVV